MAKRKVTMLEAFQASAKESAERAAAERRRLVAEREREVRREETRRTASELGQRLGAGALSAWVAGRRDDDEPAVPAPPRRAEPRVASALDELLEKDVAEAAPHRVIHPIDEQGGDERTDGEPLLHDEEPPADLEEPIDESAVADALATALETDVPATLEEPKTAAEVLESATAEEIDEAMSAIDDGVLALPMSPRTFGVLAGLTLVAAFLLGLGIGRRDESAGGPNGGPSGTDRTTAMFPADWSDDRSRETLDSEGYGPNGGRFDDHGPSDPGADPNGHVAAAAGDGLAVANDHEVPQEHPQEHTLAVPAESRETYADRAFRDPAMRYTILAITYEKSEVNEGLALATYDLLVAEGFPAIRPVDDGKRIYVFVGAAATTAELKDLQGEVASLRSGPGGRYEFRGAFLVNLDDFR